MFNKILIILTVISTVFTHANTAKAQIVEDGLVSYWSFDDAHTDGNIVIDLKGNNDGTINGAPKIVKGKFGDALEFSEAADYVDCGNDGSLTSIGSQVTVEAWIKPNDVGWGIIAGVSRSASNTYDLAFSPDRLIDWCLWNGDVETWPFHSKSQLNLGEWHHITGFYDSSKVRIYINGVIDNEQGFNGELKHNGENFLIGTRTSDNLYFKGIIDEVRVYNRALSEAEISRNMNSHGLAVVTPDKKLAFTWGRLKIN